MVVKLIHDALDIELPDLSNWAVTMLADMQRPRGQAVEHLLAQLTLLNANFTLMRRANRLLSLELDPNLQQATFHLFLLPLGNALFSHQAGPPKLANWSP